jgi:uncharacterized protein
MITRALENVLRAKIDFKKAIILLGPRQVGKTTLINAIAGKPDADFLYINGDDPATRLHWANATWSFIDQYIGTRKVIVFDEAQRIENIGLTVKMILDAQRNIQVFVSGSSALEIASTINEPLTGRKWEYHLYPLSWKEISTHYTFARALPRLENFLITGMYPEVITNPASATEILSNLAGSYLYKDILELGGIRRPEILLKLLQALAWQIGSEVSFNELAQTVNADKATVSTYIDLLEKAFVIFRLQPLARNLRNELSTSRKIYFYDNGIRNSVINNYAPLSQRNDAGALWENFVISERKKLLAYTQFYGNVYFWRNTQQAEIDYVEELDGQFRAYELKWSPGAKARFPKAFLEAYRPHGTHVIHRENFWEFLNA